MAHQPGLSCPFSGEERLGDTRGHVVAINGRNAYVSEATGNHVHQNNAIIFFTDGNGINYPSAMLADQYAAAGYLTVVADWANKFAPLDDQEPQQFLPAYTPGTIPSLDAAGRDRLIRETVDYVQNTRKISGDLGVVGYGEGLSLAMRLLTRNTMKDATVQLNNITYAGFIADPGTMTVSEIDSRTSPLSIALGDEATQPKFPLQQRLQARPSPYQLTTYSYVQDGFAVRRAATTKAELFFKKQAFSQAIIWMNEFLLGGAPLTYSKPIPPKPKPTKDKTPPEPPITTGTPPVTTNAITTVTITEPGPATNASEDQSEDEEEAGDVIDESEPTPSESGATKSRIQEIKAQAKEDHGLMFFKKTSKGRLIFKDEAGNLFDKDENSIPTPATNPHDIDTDSDGEQTGNNQKKHLHVIQVNDLYRYNSSTLKWRDQHGNKVDHDPAGYYTPSGNYFKPVSVTRRYAAPRPKGSDDNSEEEEDEEDADDEEAAEEAAEKEAEESEEESEI